jgi:2-polyprenyl-6-methoxyphenol hydroxylase-like FAD-dependent oxidoreductase
MMDAETTTHHPPPNTQHPPHNATVLIVGAGPTGLTLGIELARRGVPFRLIDREAVRPTTSRALGTQPRTVEVFRLMGISEAALRPATRPRAFRFMEGRRTLARIAFDDSGAGAPAAPLIMDESETERVLEERLVGYGGSVERGVALEGFRIDGEEAVAVLVAVDGAEEVQTRFLIGCDGANSTVRRDAGIGFVGGSYPERFLLADLDLDWEVPRDELTIWFGDAAGIAAAVPLPRERRWRIIVALDPAETDTLHFTESEAAARAEDELRRRAELPLRRIGDPLWASAFHIYRKLAGRYRAGPVFLAGDAAHVHSPVGGQGMNTGIQDAFNLGWKLALAARGQAAPGLLDSYERERRPVARAVLRGTDLGSRLLFGAHPVGRGLREYLLPAATNLGPVRRRLLAALSELTIGYRHSPLSVDAADGEDGRFRWERDRAGVRAGDRVPDADVRTPDGHTERLFDVISRGWTLLLFPGETDASAGPRAIAHLVRDMVGDAAQVFLVAASAREPMGDVPLLLDPGGVTVRAFAAQEGLAALIRPDGYLGFRGPLDRPGELASYLARIFAMRMAGG